MDLVWVLIDIRKLGSEESSEEEEEVDAVAEDEEVCDRCDPPSSHSSRIFKVRRRGVVFRGRRGRKTESSPPTEIRSQVCLSH